MESALSNIRKNEMLLCITSFANAIMEINILSVLQTTSCHMF